MPLYSHSRLQTFENCPRQFAFRYIEKPEIEQRESIEAFLGSRVHEVLEKVYRDVEMERTPKWEDVVADYERRWQREWNDRVTITRGDYTPDDYHNVGRRCLMDYFKRYFPFRDGKVIGLEQQIFIDLTRGQNDGYKLQGYIDRLQVSESGTYEVHDYKTSRNVPDQAKLDADRQLALYQIGVQDNYPDAKKVVLVWHYVRSDREVRSSRTPDQLEMLRQQTMALIDTIVEKTRTHDFPPHESALCDWCEYNQICPAKKHVVLTEALDAKSFSVDQGVIVADKFIGAKEKFDAARAEVEAARQMVLQFAEETKMTTLRGHDRLVRIRQYSRERIPSESKNPAELAELEQIVRASGKWDQVSKLADKKLRHALQTDLFDPSTKQQIAGRILRSSEQQVRISRLSQREPDE